MLGHPDSAIVHPQCYKLPGQIASTSGQDCQHRSTNCRSDCPFRVPSPLPWHGAIPFLWEILGHVRQCPLANFMILAARISGSQSSLPGFSSLRLDALAESDTDGSCSRRSLPCRQCTHLWHLKPGPSRLWLHGNAATAKAIFFFIGAYW